MAVLEHLVQENEQINGSPAIKEKQTTQKKKKGRTKD